MVCGIAGQALAKPPTHTDCNVAGGVSFVDYTTDYMDDLINVGLNTSSTGPKVAIYTGSGVWYEGVIVVSPVMFLVVISTDLKYLSSVGKEVVYQGV